MDNQSKMGTMTEADVRETVVRPFLHALGYKQFSTNNIRTEVPLRYPNLFLGKKKRKDPPLKGKADYICEVISHGRWVVEAKASNVEISRDDIEQAHSYAAHPEIRAIYFMLTNGRRFVVLDLTRFSGHLTVRSGGVHDDEEDDPVHAGVQAADGAVGARRTHAGVTVEGVWSDALEHRALGKAGRA